MKPWELRDDCRRRLGVRGSLLIRWTPGSWDTLRTVWAAYWNHAWIENLTFVPETVSSDAHGMRA